MRPRRERGQQAEDDDDAVWPALQQAQRAGHHFAPDLQRVGEAERRRRHEGGQNGQGARRRTLHGRRVPACRGGCKLPVDGARISVSEAIRAAGVRGDPEHGGSDAAGSFGDARHPAT